MLQAAALEDENVAYCTASQLADACEQAVLLARALPACTGRPHVFLELGKQVESPSPVEIGFTREGWFSLRMPMLLPKKERGSAAFVRMLLLPALRRFFQGKLPVRITPCVLVFRHVYARDRPDRALRDHDNIETNMAADCVALYVMEDDNPAACSQYECSAKGDRGAHGNLCGTPKRSSPSGCCRKNPCRRRGWSCCNIGRNTEKSLSETCLFFHGPFGTG